MRLAIADWVAEHSDELIAIRRHLHAHPEPSYKEHATTDLVMERLELAGLSPRRLTIGTGLICDIDAPVGNGSRLAFRADLDALEMVDLKDVAYASQIPGVAHACGHDVHTTIMLGVALYYAHNPDRMPGNLRFIFQPAEESVPGGALDAIRDGAVHEIGGMIGYHCEPKLEVGKVGIKPGPISSAADIMEITINGPGGHTARPELTVDTIAVAAHIVESLPDRVASLLDHPDSVKVVFGAIHGGDAPNVIPTQCVLRASVRTPLVEVWDSMAETVAKALDEVVAETGATHEVNYQMGIPPVVNHAGLFEVVRDGASAALGETNVTTAIQSWGGDDFSWFSREVPSAYIRLGTHSPDNDEMLDLHFGHFDVDESVIGLGIRLSNSLAAEFFATGRVPQMSGQSSQ